MWMYQINVLYTLKLTPHYTSIIFQLKHTFPLKHTYTCLCTCNNPAWEQPGGSWWRKGLESLYFSMLAACLDHTETNVESLNKLVWVQAGHSKLSELPRWLLTVSQSWHLRHEEKRLQGSGEGQELSLWGRRSRMVSNKTGNWTQTWKMLLHLKINICEIMSTGHKGVSGDDKDCSEHYCGRQRDSQSSEKQPWYKRPKVEQCWTCPSPCKSNS